MARSQSQRRKPSAPSDIPMAAPFTWEPRAARRLWSFGTVAAGAIGLVLAAYQVQGMKMPTPLFVTLIVALLLIAAFALAGLFYEVARNVIRWRQYRAISPGAVMTEPPGLLDYEADLVKSGKRLTKAYDEFARQTKKVGRKAERTTKAMERRGASWSAKTRQRRGNRVGKVINKATAHTEVRLGLLKALVNDVLRNAEGMVGNTDLSAKNPEDIQNAKEFRDTLMGTHTEGTEAAESLAGYRDTMRNTEQLNLSRAITIASRRLVGALDGVLETLQRHTTDSRRLAALLDAKISAAERSQP